jgi:hypothetical protein
LPFDRVSRPSPDPRPSPIANVDFSFGKQKLCYPAAEAVAPFQGGSARGWLFEPIRRPKIWTMMIFHLELCKLLKSHKTDKTLFVKARYYVASVQGISRRAPPTITKEN